jgi:outer membrane receptor protein involved in Fe transport
MVDTFSNDDLIITGTVKDAETGEPLEFATVSLLSAADSSLVGGNITMMDGRFEINGKPGKYILKLQFVSYQDKFIDDVVFDGAIDYVDLGEVYMSTSTEFLKEIVVSADRSQMQLELDKRVFNVSENLNNIGASADQIMDNLPSVSVDVDGNVSLRGSTNVRILVNGKPSGLLGIGNSDGLRQLQADLIDRIEVITNPSARYDAEGSAGIINIILKKDVRKGFNGSFTANAGFPLNYGLSGNINYRTGKFNLFGSYGINYRENPGGGFTNRISYGGGDTLKTYIDNDRLRSGYSHNLRFGTDFYFNDNNIFTASALTRISDQQNTTSITYFDWDTDDNLIENTSREDREKEEDINKEFTATFRRIMEGEGHELVAEFQYRESNEIERSAIDSANLLTESDPLLFQRSLNDEGDKNILMQVDYVYPFADGKKFEAGYRGTIRQISSDYTVEQINEEGEWISLENFTNQFIYDEDVHALYSIFESKMDKWGYQIGLRLEQTYINTYQRETDQTNTKEYLNAFPSVFLSYKLDEKKSIQTSYSRRIARPRFWYLNPFSSFSDPRNIRMGNTDLNPEYTNSFEIGWLHNLDKSSFYLGGYYRYITGVHTKKYWNRKCLWNRRQL